MDRLSALTAALNSAALLAAALLPPTLIAAVLAGCQAEPEAPFDAGLLIDAGDAAPAADGEPPDDAGDADPIECEPLPIADCFRGLAFADCGGGGPPTVGCGVVGGRYGCLWFEGGCLPAEYLSAAPCQDESCLDQNVAWGATPWTRTRAMDLDVHVDSALDPAPEATLECLCDGEPPCLGRFPLCRSDELEGYTAWHSPASDATAWALPGLVAVQMWGRGQIAELTSDRMLVIELDLYVTLPRARACLIPTSDGLASREVVCAERGAITIDDSPTDAVGVATMHGRFDIAFPAVPLREDLVPVEGLVLRGAF